MKKVITGNHAASYGAMLSRAQVIAAYPITPQTQIVELLSEFCANGVMKAKFINVESEHSAMAACIGASVTGARAFTATASHGLALMHEMLHSATCMRLPIVMANVNRAMGTNWSIWSDQTDSLSQRDTGWIQFYCESNQEVLDTVIQAYKVSERVLLPSMLTLDAFFLSHTAEIVDIPDIERVDSYLPKYDPPYKLDPDNPHTFGGITTPPFYLELRYKIQKAMEEALKAAKEADQEFKEVFGRSWGLVEGYKTEDAEVILVTSGTVASTSRVVVDERRLRGERVGMLKIRLFRPFPKEEVRQILKVAEKVAVIDRNISFGQGGIFASEVMAALCNYKKLIYGFIAGLGGRDITPGTIHQVIDYTLKEPPKDIIWIGLKWE